ncbi:hypothetical protein HPP92_004844 [Vanilla planifolia]|uniref:Damage-control phosphatase ARMT1-like metal-binding domain-containing protein n=1 Tax=Vanilla planifolia TaxID=51239 RepID=A0A835RMB4_VANPL|nr:hypothetical protein HPP92_004844 [Vanilla planifolia]
MGKEHPPYKRALMFVDNSGADIILGICFLCYVSCFALELSIVTSLNESCRSWRLLFDAMVDMEDELKDNVTSVPLMAVESGCGGPCIDFRQVSSELAAAAKGSDLLVSSTVIVLDLSNDGNDGGIG